MTTDAYLDLMNASSAHVYQVWFDDNLVATSDDYFRILELAKCYGVGDSDVKIFRRDLVSSETPKGAAIIKKAMAGGKRSVRRRGLAPVASTEIRSVGSPPGEDETAVTAVAAAVALWRDQEGPGGQGVPSFTVVYTMLGYRKRGAGTAAAAMAKGIARLEGRPVAGDDDDDDDSDSDSDSDSDDVDAAAAAIIAHGEKVRKAAGKRWAKEKKGRKKRSGQ